MAANMFSFKLKFKQKKIKKKIVAAKIDRIPDWYDAALKVRTSTFSYTFNRSMMTTGMRIYTGDNPTNKIVLVKYPSMSGFRRVEKDKLEFQPVRKNGINIQYTTNKEIVSEEICKRRKYRF